MSEARFSHAIGKIGLFSKASPLGPVDDVPFHGHRQSQEGDQSAYTQNDMPPVMFSIL